MGSLRKVKKLHAHTSVGARFSISTSKTEIFTLKVRGKWVVFHYRIAPIGGRFWPTHKPIGNVGGGGGGGQ